MQKDLTSEQSCAVERVIEPSPEAPLCCGTGCTVCVLDYPEFHSTESCSDNLEALLRAVEEAQEQAEQMIARMSGDTNLS